jgi:hypothetical protein
MPEDAILHSHCSENLKSYKGCSKLTAGRNKHELQWLQDPRKINGGNSDNARCAASGHFRNKGKEHLKGTINEIAKNSKNKNIRDLHRGINVFERDYQTKSNLV